MKRDIRSILKDDAGIYDKKLPENHRQEFYDKLKTQNQKQPTSRVWLKIAAVFLIVFAIGFLIIKNNSNTKKIVPITAQIEAIETEYLKNIHKEWNNFVALAEDEILVKRYKDKLEALDYSYKQISKQFQQDSNNLVVIEDLINNLQTRLKLLKDIQSQIKLIQQKRLL